MNQAFHYFFGQIFGIISWWFFKVFQCLQCAILWKRIKYAKNVTKNEEKSYSTCLKTHFSNGLLKPETQVLGSRSVITFDSMLYGPPCGLIWLLIAKTLEKSNDARTQLRHRRVVLYYMVYYRDTAWDSQKDDTVENWEKHKNYLKTWKDIHPIL